jgi:reactive intermediate/imine deaminase
MRSKITAVIVLGLAFVGVTVTLVGQQPAAPPFRPAVHAGRFIYLSGALGMGADGKLVAGDVKAQTKQVLENLKRTLEQNGSRLDKVVSASVYLKRAADFAAMNEVYATYWRSDPPARTTVITNLVVPEALVEISMIAVDNDAGRVVVHPAAWIKSPSPYSYGVRSGDTLFLAGLVSRNGKDNTTVAGDITVQTNTAMRNAGEILKAAGMDYSNVVSARVFLTDTTAFEAMNAAYRACFPKDPPARATVRTGLTSPDYLVEITLTAVAGGERTAIVAPNADGTPGRMNPNLSAGVKVGNRLFLSGMLGNNDTNAGDVGGQTRETLARIGRTLKAAGFDWSHVVDSTVYLTDAGRAPAMNDAYRQVIGKDFPARTTCETGLMSPAGLVEIMMSAAKGR